LLLSFPILQSLLFFVLLAISNAGLQNYSIVALGELYGTPFGVASTALSGYLLLTAVGVLAGGFVAARTGRHALVAALGVCAFAVVALMIGIQDFGAAVLIMLMSVAGFLTGVIMPSRDLIVRENTPPGSFGKVFGFVTTGFNIGGIVAPLVFGILMDNNSPRGVFFFVAAVSLVSVLTVLAIPKTRASTP
jgi:MFS transporter, FSR family, fosmidomycin resistance protein